MIDGVIGSAANWLAGFRPSLRTGLLIAFLFGFVVRMIPEMLSYPYPIGFDTIYYGFRLEEGVVWSHWSGFFSTWLIYGVLVFVKSLLRVDPFLLLKATAPLLFGLNASGIFFMATKAFNWSVRKSLFAVGLFSFQIAILGISWHFYRNLLGLGILLFTLPWIVKDKVSLKSLALFSVLSVLVVFGHEYASVLLFASVLTVVSISFFNKKGREAAKVLAAALPAASVFLTSLLLKLYPVYQVSDPNILTAYQPQGYYSGPLFFMTNYLTVSDTFQYYPTYLDLVASVGSLFVILYAALLPLVIVGFFRHRVLDVWTVLLGVGGFGCLVVPFFALNFWNRWMLMLVFPMTYYAANGVVKVMHSSVPVTASIGRLGSLRVSQRVGKGLVLVSVVSGFAFMTSPMFFGKWGVFCLPTTTPYVPSTMLSNSVPLSDVDGIVDAFEWVDTAMDGDSCFLAQDGLFYWARFFLGGKHTIVFFENDVYGAVDVGAEHGFGQFWLVWWNTDIGWHGFTVPNNFKQVHSAGRISVFEYSG